MFNVEHRLNDGWMLDVAASYADSTYQVPGFGHLVPRRPPSSRSHWRTFVSRPMRTRAPASFPAKSHGSVSTGNTLHEVVLGLNFSNFSRDQAISLCGNNFAFDPRVAEVDGLPSVHFHVDDQLAVVTAMLTGKPGARAFSRANPRRPKKQATIDALGPYLQGYGLDMLEVRCGITDQDLDEDRYEFNTHVVSHLSESLQNVLGLSVTHNSITSRTYLNGTVEQDSIHVYDTLRYSPR